MIVGISGKRGVGKTTAADRMVDKHKFIKVSFAGELKKLAKTIFPFTDTDLTSVLKKEKPFKTKNRIYDFTPRDFLVHLGEFCRFHDESYWVDKALEQCAGYNDGKNFVFDDVRYKNEADIIKKSGGLVIRIERYEKFNPYGKNLDIKSETDLDDYAFDHVVERMWNIKVEDLYRQVDSFVEDKCHQKK